MDLLSEQIKEIQNQFSTVQAKFAEDQRVILVSNQQKDLEIISIQKQIEQQKQILSSEQEQIKQIQSQLSGMQTPSIVNEQEIQCQKMQIESQDDEIFRLQRQLELINNPVISEHINTSTNESNQQSPITMSQNENQKEEVIIQEPVQSETDPSVTLSSTQLIQPIIKNLEHKKEHKSVKGLNKIKLNINAPILRDLSAITEKRRLWTKKIELEQINSDLSDLFKNLAENTLDKQQKADLKSQIGALKLSKLILEDEIDSLIQEAEDRNSLKAFIAFKNISVSGAERKLEQMKGNNERMIQTLKILKKQNGLKGIYKELERVL
ncbi:Hypothetical_protein [Hexamita inflata]|uniref:Hypothetical_protein n=1 Tax=Hexamita inflata TaxID=28002 RepID=A0AA86R8N3_9EUKA|nr:Hypothetical protein HINF_LOCUS59217 [Hexamita inflata]